MSRFLPSLFVIFLMLGAMAVALLAWCDSRISAMLRKGELALLDAVAEVKAKDLESWIHQQLADISTWLHGLIDQFENIYAWLGTNQEQEQDISKFMHVAGNGILQVLADSRKCDSQLSQLIDTLHRKGTALVTTKGRLPNV